MYNNLCSFNNLVIHICNANANVKNQPFIFVCPIIHILYICNTHPLFFVKKPIFISQLGTCHSNQASLLLPCHYNLCAAVGHPSPQRASQSLSSLALNLYPYSYQQLLASETDPSSWLVCLWEQSVCSYYKSWKQPLPQSLCVFRLSLSLKKRSNKPWILIIYLLTIYIYIHSCIT